ncbi:hypothetical protein BADSM9389_14320 [Buttiauxella agrestis]|nr:hypothetical protein BADSM9389_14320 [Buttiauxella agrestis]
MLDETPAPAHWLADAITAALRPQQRHPLPFNKAAPKRTAAGTQCLIGKTGTREAVNWYKDDPHGTADGLSLSEFKKQDIPQPKAKPLTLAQQQEQQKRRECDERAKAKKQTQRRAAKLKAAQEAARAALAAEPPDLLDILEAKADPKKSRGSIPRIRMPGQAHHHHPTAEDLDALRQAIPMHNGKPYDNRQIMAALRQIVGIAA